MARPRSEAARAKMLSAASDIVFTGGLCGFTIDEVAYRSGVAKTTIYRHFPSKNQLLIAALDRGIAVPPTPDTGSLREDLLEFLASVLPIFADPTLRMVSLDILSAGTRDPELDRFYRSMLQGRMGPLTTIFERGQARGEIAPDMDFDTAFDIIEGPLVIRSLFRPETLQDFDLESMVDRSLVLLKA